MIMMTITTHLSQQLYALLVTFVGGPLQPPPKPEGGGLKGAHLLYWYFPLKPNQPKQVFGFNRGIHLKSAKQV